MATNTSKRRVGLPLVLAGIAVLAAAISVGIASTPSGAGPGIVSASSGGWVLKSTEASKYDEDNDPNDCYSGSEVTVDGLSGTTYQRCSGTDYDVYQQTQHSWSAAPPERLAPGEMLRITSTTSVEGTFHTVGLGGGASTWVRIDLVPGGGPYPGAGWASATEEDTPVSAVSEFSIPSGSEGVLMTVALTFQSVAGSGQTTYTYEWEETATGATPSAEVSSSTAPPAHDPSPTPVTPVPSYATRPLIDAKDASGTVFYSPASEAGIEPPRRTWLPIAPGQDINLEEGAMLRTGRDGTVAIHIWSSGSEARLKPSTLFEIHMPDPVRTPTSVVAARLWQGIAEFYMDALRGRSEENLNVETDLAKTSIKGTVYEIEVTDTATVVTVTEGVVEVTEKATGTIIDVGAGERATVDAMGMTKSAAPSDSLLEAGGDGLPVLLVLGAIVVGAIALVSVAGLIFVRKRKQAI